MRLPFSLVLVCAWLVAIPTPLAGQQSAPVAGLDSLVLERTLCYGTCPAYRLTLRRDGILRIQSRNRRDTGSVVEDTLNAVVLYFLEQRARSIEFDKFPANIAADRAMCRDSATDHPTIIIGLFGPGPYSKLVEYYTGCYTVCCHHAVEESLHRLAEFAAQIDTATRSARWVRPSRRR